MTESDPTNADRAVSTTEFAVGEIVFGTYRIIEKVGTGGMGSVYKARNVVLNRIEALKVIQGEHLTSKDIVRFQNEAKALSRLDHHNIVTVFDFGVAGSVPYISMEFLEGETLDEVLKARGKLETDELIDIFLQVCEGLVHAHSKGVIHRDLKTTNIIVSHDQSGMLRVVLIDFGVAKVEVADETQRISAPGVFVGSPLYVSPEQIDAKPADARSDIYSLGCIMFQALAGRPPFQADSILQILAMHKGAMPPLSVLDENSSAPAPLRELISATLEKQPAARPPDVKAVMTKLSQIADLLNSDTSSAREDADPGSDPEERSKARGVPAVFIMAGVAAISIALILFLPKAFTVPEKVKLSLPSGSLHYVPNSDSERVAANLFSPAETKNKASALLTEANTLLSHRDDREKIREAEEKYKECLELNRHMRGNRVIDIQHCLIGLGKIADYRGDHKTAMIYLEESSKVIPQGAENRVSLLNTASVSQELAIKALSQKRVQEELDYLWLSIKLYDESLGSNSPQAIECRTMAACGYLRLNKFSDASDLLESIKTALELQQCKDRRYVSVLILLGQTNWRLGNFQISKDYYGLAEKAMKGLSYKGKKDDIFSLKTGLALTMLSAKEYTESEQAALSCKRELHGLDKKNREYLDWLIRNIRNARWNQAGVKRSSR